MIDTSSTFNGWSFVEGFMLGVLTVFAWALATIDGFRK